MGCCLGCGNGLVFLTGAVLVVAVLLVVVVPVVWASVPPTETVAVLVVCLVFVSGVVEPSPDVGESLEGYSVVSPVSVRDRGNDALLGSVVVASLPALLFALVVGAAVVAPGFNLVWSIWTFATAEDDALIGLSL